MLRLKICYISRILLFPHLKEISVLTEAFDTILSLDRYHVVTFRVKRLTFPILGQIITIKFDFDVPTCLFMGCKYIKEFLYIASKSDVCSKNIKFRSLYEIGATLKSFDLNLEKD